MRNKFLESPLSPTMGMNLLIQERGKLRSTSIELQKFKIFGLNIKNATDIFQQPYVGQFNKLNEINQKKVCFIIAGEKYAKQLHQQLKNS
jgi:hypothetical protein